MTPMTLRVAAALATIAAVTAGAPVTAQQSGESGFRFRSRAELVNVTATVTDGDGRFVGGLRREDFSIFEDGEPQPITHFSDEHVPVSLGLVVDASGSMEGEKWDAAQDAIARFLDQLGPEDEVFLYAFSDRTALVEGWTSQRSRIRGAMARIRPRGGTAMYDAVAEAIPIAQEGSRRKRALVVISDGNDRNSATDIRSLRQLIRETEVLIYAVGIDGESERPVWTGGRPRVPPIPLPIPIPGRRPPPQWPGPQQPQPRYPRGGTGSADDRVNVAALRELTDDSGGRTEVVRDARDLGPATAGIADELSRQYSLAYTPVAPKDGRWHSIRVEVRHRGYLVRARRGYVALP